MWWDKVCLAPGQLWEEGFCDGLIDASCFICIISEGAINHPQIRHQNFTIFSANSKIDNVLLEWRFALELKERGVIDGIFPVLIGKPHAVTPSKYIDYFSSGSHPSPLPEVAVASVEGKLREHLERQSFGSPFVTSMTVKEVVSRIVSYQGAVLRDSYEEAITDATHAIVGFCESRLAGVDQGEAEAETLDHGEIGGCGVGKGHTESSGLFSTSRGKRESSTPATVAVTRPQLLCCLLSVLSAAAGAAGAVTDVRTLMNPQAHQPRRPVL